MMFCEHVLLFLASFCLFTSALFALSSFFPSVKAVFFRTGLVLTAASFFSCSTFFLKKISLFSTNLAVASFLEKKLRLPGNVFSTALYFEANHEEAKHVSNALLKRLLEDARRECEKLQLSACFDRTPLKRAFLMFCAVLLLSFSLLSYSSAGLRQTKKQARIQKKTASGAKKKTPFRLYNLAWNIHYPPHTGLSAKTLDAVESVTVPYGSRIVFSGESNLPVSRARIESSDKKAEFVLNNRSFRGKLTATQSQRVVMQFESKARKKTIAFMLKIEKDKSPQVALSQPSESEMTFYGKEIPLEILATDDYGVSKLVLVVQKNRGKPSVFPLSFNKSSEVVLRYAFSPGAFLQKSGDEITCMVDAYDNDPFFGPKRARSNVFRVLFPKIIEQKETKQKPQKSVETRSQELYEKQSALHEELEETLKDIKTSQSLTAEQKESLLGMTEKQENLFKEAQDFQDAVKELQGNPSAREDLKELVSVLAEVDKLMAEIMSQDMKKMLEQLRDAIKNTQISEIEKKLMDAKFTQEELLRKFKQTMNWLKLAKEEQFLSMLEKTLEELLKRQEELVSKTKELPEMPEGMSKEFKWKELSFEQNALKKDAGDFQKMLEKEHEKLKDEKHDLQKPLSDLRKDMDNKGIHEKMSRASNSLSQEDFNDSFSYEKQSENALSELLQKFQELKSGWMQGQKKKFARILYELTSDVLLISQREEDVQNDLAALRSISQTDLFTSYKTPLQDASSRQEKLSAQEEKITLKLSRLAEILPVVDAGLLSKASGLHQLMKNAQKNMEDGLIPQAETLAQRAVDGLNTLAEELLKVQEKAKNFSASKMLEDYLKQLEDLAAMQDMLNAQTQQFFANGEMSLFGLKQLAFEQGKLAEMLSKLSGGMKPVSPSASSMLGGAADEMDEVAERIKQKDVGKDVQKIQKKIHHKLLEAQMALKDQGKEEGRKAETAKTYKSSKVIKPLVLKKEPFFKMKITKPKWDETHVPPEYRDMVKQYLKAIDGRM